MQLCYDKTLFTKLVVHNLLTPELTPYLAQDLEKMKKDPGGATGAKRPIAASYQPGEIGDKQPHAWAAKAPQALLQFLSLRRVLFHCHKYEEYWKWRICS